MSRQLSTFSLSSNIRFKLAESGFSTADELTDYNPHELSKQTDLSIEEALDLLETVFSRESNKKDITSRCSAFDVLSIENSLTPITTSCKALDAIMNGGFPLRRVTEICGSPGAGKTQLCMQLCTNVQIPKYLGGLEGEAFYIDTEGSFIVQRLIQIANGTVDEYKTKLKGLQSFTVEKILKGTYYYPCKSYQEIIARINLLHQFLEEHKKVVLVVVDSIAFHFRYGFDGSYSLRSRLLNGVMQSLVKVAEDHNVAVVLTNQMTTKINDGSSQLLPALGESWGHACSVRLMLSWTEEQRQAYILKSSFLAEGEAIYSITRNGFRDVSDSVHSSINDL